MYTASETAAADIRKKMLKRLWRLLRTALGILTVYTLYSFWFYRHHNFSTADWLSTKYNLSSWLRLLIFNSSMVIWDYSYRFDFIWYLLAMIWVQLFMIVICTWHKDIKRSICICLMCLLYVCQYMSYSAYIPLLTINANNVPFYRNWLFLGIPFTLVGVWIAEADIRTKYTPVIWWSLALCGGYLAVREYTYFVHRELSLGIAMLTIALVILAEYYPHLGIRPLVFVGKHLAANVYYWHVLIASVLGQLTAAYMPQINISKIFPYLVIGCTLLFALGIYYIQRLLIAKKQQP